MKRSERNKVKTNPNQQHPDPNHPEGDNHERHISGSINVRGEIETKRPPDLVKEHATERKEDAAHEKKKFVVECITLAVVAIYAGLTAWQGCSTKTAADAAQSAAITADATLKSSKEQFRTDERPYLWAGPKAAFSDTKGQGVIFIPVGNDKVSVNIAVDVVNSGKSPAIEVIATPSHLKIGPSEVAAKEAKDWRPDYPDFAGAILNSSTNVSLTVGTETQVITKEQGTLWKQGKWQIYVVGAVKYRDVFAPRIEPYETTYCFVLLPTGKPFGNCASGISMK